METVRHAFEIPAYVRHGDEERPALLYPILSSQQMAKVCYEDGRFSDVWWSKVRSLEVEDVMDEYGFECEE